MLKIMNLNINENKFIIESGFEEKINKLRKLGKLKLKLILYDDSNGFNYLNDLKESKEKLPEIIFVDCHYYHWLFNNCELVNMSIMDRIIRSNDYSWNITTNYYVTIEFKYSDVVGNTNRKIIERDTKIKNFLKDE